MKIPFACEKVRVTSIYGKRTLNGKTSTHYGYDLVGMGSWDVTAAVGGTVVCSRIVTDKNDWHWQWGNYVCVKTDAGQYHYYCHMASRNVSEGKRVKAGDKLGVMGNTGYSFGAHLHFEVRASDNLTRICPETVLGIENKLGVYEITDDTRTEDAIDVLTRAGIIGTPEFWRAHYKQLTYLDKLIRNMGDYVEKHK